VTTPAYRTLIDLIADRTEALLTAAWERPDAAISGCPGWTCHDLVEHIGAVQAFWAEAVGRGASERRPDVDIKPPADGLIAWAADAADALVGALRAAGPEDSAWTWWGEPRTAGAIARHQVQEAAVHAWDAQDAVGRASAIPEVIAVDGVDEFLAIVERVNQPWPAEPATVTLAINGDPNPWMVALGSGDVQVHRDHGPGGVVLSGAASDVVLALYRRRDLDSLTVQGDRDLAGRFIGWSDLG
jgi:uncharacterized protein (TIGR03083 family)